MGILELGHAQSRVQCRAAATGAKRLRLRAPTEGLNDSRVQVLLIAVNQTFSTVTL